jgi:hypothetical protein
MPMSVQKTVCVVVRVEQQQKRLHFATSFLFSPSSSQLIINEIGALIHTWDVEWALQFVLSISLSLCLFASICHHQ